MHNIAGKAHKIVYLFFIVLLLYILVSVWVAHFSPINSSFLQPDFR